MEDIYLNVDYLSKWIIPLGIISMLNTIVKGIIGTVHTRVGFHFNSGSTLKPQFKFFPVRFDEKNVWSEFALLEMKLTSTLVHTIMSVLHKERSCRMFLIAVNRPGGGRGMINKTLWIPSCVTDSHCPTLTVSLPQNDISYHHTTRTSLPALPANSAAHSSPLVFFLPAIISGESFPKKWLYCIVL